MKMKSDVDWIFVIFTTLVFVIVEGSFHSPCVECQIFNEMHKDDPAPLNGKNEFCSYPCQCPIYEIECDHGVNYIKDGCDCCYMCARQHGDQCTLKDKCDSKKDLYCDPRTPDGHTGVCKAFVAKPCVVKGAVYKDGEQFKPDCARMCTCQNGKYGCVNLCSQEQKKPSKNHCLNSHLVTIPGRCCKEWTCDHTLGDDSSRYRVMESQNMILQLPTQRPPSNMYKHPCKIYTAKWSPCSVTCDVGTSVRLTNDNLKCAEIQQTRLCFLRPCGHVIKTQGRQKCTPTTRSKERHYIVFQNCKSKNRYNLKFCTTCKDRKCCYPKRTKTKMMEFKCSGGRRELLSFMWIKKCQCDKECYTHRLEER